MARQLCLFPTFSLAAAVLVLLWTAAAWAGNMYFYKDAGGTLHFTNAPTTTNYRVFAVFGRFSKVGKAEILRVVRDASNRHGVDHRLVQAVIQVESNFDHKALSPKGAQGLMQIMPGTCRALGVKSPFDLDENIEAGVRYLRMQINRFGSYSLALAAYNAGPGQVERYGGIPPFPETRQYVRKVLAIFNRLKGS